MIRHPPKYSTQPNCGCASQYQPSANIEIGLVTQYDQTHGNDAHGFLCVIGAMAVCESNGGWYLGGFEEYVRFWCGPLAAANVICMTNNPTTNPIMGEKNSAVPTINSPSI